MYSTDNEGKSAVAERFIRTIKNKIYKYMTSISKNMYIDKLDDIVNKYNDINHRTIQMKPIDFKDNTYIYIKNMYIDKLDDIVNKYDNIYHGTIQMKPIDVKGNTYIDFGKEVNDNDPKFKVGDHVRISQYKNIFAKSYTPNCSEEIFVIKKIENTVPWIYIINDLNCADRRSIKI